MMATILARAWCFGRPLAAVLLIVALACSLPASVLADAKGAAKRNEDAPPPEEQRELITSDGVVLAVTFYPGTKGKESIPVVLLHGFKGSRKDFASLALYLQQRGHAVLVPDLRGHGESVRTRPATRRLDADAMPSEAFLPMVTADMEACKKFLMERNNVGQLNIEKLCLVGAEMGSVVALDYARLDWSWPRLVQVKQGQDVKAVILLSPQWSFRSLQIRPALNAPAILGNLATMIIVGEQDQRPSREAKRLNTMLLRSHPSADAEKMSDRTLVFLPLATSLQGVKLLDAPELKVREWIAWFIEHRLVQQKLPWKKRVTMPTED